MAKGKGKGRGRGQGRGGGERGEARELALMALCHLESYDAFERDEALAIFWDNPPGLGQEGAPAIEAWSAKAGVRSFAERLLAALGEAGGRTDAIIEETSRRWRVERMDRIDRNILRLVVAELQAVPETPRGVILAEAVRLAARYGGERSAPFVNGLAESLARRLRPAAQR
jgi:N utilization substance protein B